MKLNTAIILGALLVLLSSISTRTYAQMTYLTLPSPIERDSLQMHIETLNQAKKGDVIRIITDSPGGDVVEMIEMVKAIKNTKATVECGIQQFAASAAAVITASCHKFGMAKNAIILFHMPSRYYSFFGIDITSDIITVDDWCPAAAKNARLFAKYMEFLGIRQLMTEQQWEEMLHGKDIILTGEDIARNLGAKR